MARSKTSMCNIALGMIGDKTTITNIDTHTSKAAIICRLYFEEVRDQVIADPRVDFKCARTRAQLAQLDDNPDFNWSYQYGLPADYLRLRRHVEDEADINGYLYLTPGDTSSLPYTEETVKVDDKDVQVLLTNFDECRILYIKQVENVALFKPHLAQAICTLLAARIALPLGAADKAKDLLLQYEQLDLPMARKENQAGVYVQDEEGILVWGDSGRYG